MKGMKSIVFYASVQKVVMIQIRNQQLLKKKKQPQMPESCRRKVLSPSP